MESETGCVLLALRSPRASLNCSKARLNCLCERWRRPLFKAAVNGSDEVREIEEGSLILGSGGTEKLANVNDVSAEEMDGAGP